MKRGVGEGVGMREGWGRDEEGVKEGGRECERGRGGE